ncbi:MAG: transposase, partial [Crocinitomicaceae bacterium]|nr:transposase [Crocinitomicaceae bacterium]
MKNIAGNTVSFTWKDYREGGKKKVMTLDAMEFVRRFAMHILPKGFVRIRHYGILSSTAKRKKLPQIKAHFGILQNGNETYPHGEL